MLRSEGFASQLCFFNDELPMDNKVRDYVSKWLMTLLMSENSTTASTNEFPVITKKIRDETLGESKNNFFHRSNFYMTVKAMLQHSLTVELGAELGKILYKIVMLRFLDEICSTYTSQDSGECKALNIDLMSQLIAKIARRIEKISDANVVEAMTTKVIDLYNETISRAKSTIKAIRGKIDEQIRVLQRIDEKKAKLKPLVDLEFESGICYEAPQLQEYLSRRNAMEQSENGGYFKQNVKSYRRYNHEFSNKHQRPDMMTMMRATQDHQDLCMLWTDFECMVLYGMSLNDEAYPPEELRQDLSNYVAFTKKTYNGDPLMISRMMLVYLKLIEVLDRRATLQYPLLKKHRCGIDSSIINSLLLPQRVDMDTAYRLETYFRCRNERSSGFPSLTDEDRVSDQSFAVKLVKEHPEMLEIRNQIQRLNENCEQRKREQWMKSREEVKRIRDEMNRSEHRFFTNRFGEIHHDKRCERCDLGRRAAKMRLEEFEQLLPKNEAEQFAVVFELRIPNIIACLRDVLYGFAKICPGETEKLKIKGYWIECDKLCDFNQSNSKYVHLGSTKKRPLEYVHVDNNFSAFIVQNSFNCVYESNHEALPKPPSPSDDAIKHLNAFKTQDEYSGLQWALNSTEHTENEVLSRQSDCPRNLSLNEFKNFGILRADGHRLQLRKLFALIETEALSFEKESVLLLIMQVLWECGISGAAKAIRESHIDFNDHEFCTAVIELLDTFVDQQRDNWMPFKLLMATVIAVRAFEMNNDETVADQIIKFVNDVRATVWDWIDKIERVIHEARNPNETSERDLRSKLIYVAITGALTFNVHKKHPHYSKIFEDTNVDVNQRTAVNSWLHFIIVLRNNINLYENHENALPTTLRILLRLTEICGINSEPKVKELINADRHGVFDLIKMHWSAGNQGYLTRMIFVDEYPHILYVETISRSVTHFAEIDVIKGLFFVNGLPLSRLPYEMTQHEMYQRVFGNASFEVQRDSSYRFCTVQKNSEFTYEFEHSNGNLIVTERSANNSDYVNELIPFTSLARQFPYLLISQYVHWWNKQTNCIEFRQRSYGHRNYMKRTPIDYEWNLASKHLVHMKSKRPMMNFKHPTYKRIADHLVRLEDQKYIHVLLNAPRVASVELSRMKLKFELDCSGVAAQEEYFLESKEFNGMRVSRVQRIGTLYGLSQGLVLESGGSESTSTTKILLMPHGQVNIVASNLHVFVNIDTKTGIFQVF